MSFGCPAVLAPCGALPEVGGDSALFAEPADPRQWVAAIRRLADDADFWANYSAQAANVRAHLPGGAQDKNWSMLSKRLFWPMSPKVDSTSMTTHSPSRIAIVIASTGRPVELGRWSDHVRRQTLPPSALVYAVAKPTDLPRCGDLQGAVAVVASVPGLPIQRNAGLEAVIRSNDIIAYFDDDYVPSSYCVEGIQPLFSNAS